MDGLLVVGGPLLLPLVCRQRILWWLVILMSTLSIAVILATLREEMQDQALGLAHRWIIAAQALNLTGLLFVRKNRSSPSPAPGPAGEN